MTEIISGVLKLTFGFLVNKARSKISERLNDGDVTDEECRRLIVRELDDIKRKLDGLARKDLLSSLCFLKEGINGLYQSLLQFRASEKGPESTEQAISAGATSSKATSPVSQINEATALINAFNSLKIHSKERYLSAIESFKLARENATKAFCNEGLSIVDRIQASQVRMMARILEKLEDPDAGVNDCLQYLEELHDIRAIQEIFSVLIDGGIKSRFNKTKRLNNASSVHQMNLLLFDFARRFTNLRRVFFDWPGILLGKETSHPLVVNDRVIQKYEESGVEITSTYLDFTLPKSIDLSYCVLNNKGEIVAQIGFRDSTAVQILKRSEESRTIFNFLKRSFHGSYCEVAALDVDVKDNVYVISAFQKSRDQPWSYKLLIFDEKGNIKLESLIPFQHDSPFYLRMTVSNAKKIAVLDTRKQIVHLGNSCETNSFEVYNSFHLDKLFDGMNAIRFLDNNGTKIIVAGYGHCFYIYTEHGELERKIMIPKEYGNLSSFAVNYITKQILVKSGWPSLSLCSFSETGELESHVCLGSYTKHEKLYCAELISNAHGLVALVDKARVVFLQQF